MERIPSRVKTVSSFLEIPNVLRTQNLLQLEKKKPKTKTNPKNTHYIECSSVQTWLTKDYFFYILTLHRIYFVKYFGRVIKVFGNKFLDKDSTSEIVK